MLWTMFVALQAVEPSANLANALLTQPQQCPRPSGNDDEVVVCGRRDGQSPYRVGPQPDVPSDLPDAEFRLFDGVKAKLSAEQGHVGGIPTNRAMVSIKIGF